jgi:hypothetical protein
MADELEGLQPYERFNKEDTERRKKDIKNTLCCPYCGEKLEKCEVPQNVFTQWPNEYLYLCLSDECPYFIRGWDAMAGLGRNCTHRLMYDPLTDSCNPMPVHSNSILKGQIIEE